MDMLKHSHLSAASQHPKTNTNRLKTRQKTGPKITGRLQRGSTLSRGSTTMFSGLNEIIKRDYAYFLLRMYYSISFTRFSDQKTHQFSYTENTYSALIGQITHA